MTLHERRAVLAKIGYYKQARKAIDKSLQAIGSLEELEAAIAKLKGEQKD